MKQFTLLSLSLLLLPLVAMGQQVQPDTWVCTDALGRPVATRGNGVARDVDPEVKIGMFYYVWHGQHGGEVRDIPALLQANPANPQWGAVHQFHWCGRPALGYYAGGDAYIVARHMQMLVDAGVDFYFFDVTNAFPYDNQIRTVLNEARRRKGLGLPYPRMAFCCHSGTSDVVNHVYRQWYSDPTWADFWFLWDGKPLILVDRAQLGGVSAQVRQFFTIRHSWAWEEGEDCWPWLANYPQQRNFTVKGGRRVYEQMSVSAAQHPYSKIGKSYRNGRQPAVDKYGLCSRTPWGDYLSEQFAQATRARVPVLMITQWNEWMAQRFVVETEGQKYMTRPGAAQAVGETYFVDAYNQEFNRDLEPSSDPLLLDNYYLHLTSLIRKYRGANALPQPTVLKTIDLEGPLAQWDEVEPCYADEPGDASLRSATAQPTECRRRNSWDFVRCRVSKDGEHLFFLAETKGNVLSPPSRNVQSTYLTLLINRDLSHHTGWEGYDLKVQYQSATGEYTLCEWNDEAHAWRDISPVQAVRQGPSIAYAIPRQMAGMEADTDFDFKWIDNTPMAMTSAMDFISCGDCAPNGRFAYRYLGSRLATPTGIRPPQSVPKVHTPAYTLQGLPAPPHHRGVVLWNGRKVVR